MPKVDKFTFPHRKTGTKISVDISFGVMKYHPDYQLRGKKFFYVTLEEGPKLHYGKLYVHADTIDEVKKLIDDVINEYLDNDRKIRKVILYKIGAKSMMLEKDLPQRANRWYSDIAVKDEDHVWPEIEISVQYKIGYEIIIGNNKYFSKYETGANVNRFADDTYKCIDWTPEREVWIQTLYHSLDQLAKGFKRFIKMDDETATRLIDSNRQLISTPE